MQFAVRMPNDVRLPALPALHILRSLGRGGMGAVFLATDRDHHRGVALKVIASDEMSDQVARARFAREIEAVSSIHHVNVVRLLDAGSVGGIPYALFERVRGRSLLRLDVQPWRVVVDLGRQLAAAVAAVHTAGWVHRDIKPGNVMVSKHGIVKLIDFGVAKRVLGPDGPRGSVSPEPMLTDSGTVVGTRRYLAPEILHGRRATPASDVFSLGLVLRDLLDDDTPIAGAFADLLERAMAEDAGGRPTAAAIESCLDELPAERGIFASHPVEDLPTWPADADERRTRNGGG